jgi:16S rRNA (adenine1518-N6/adenine1519-N6)-dimethyltransferase
VPPPKVTSTVVRLRRRPAPLALARFETLETITAAAFGQRRKMLRSAMKTLGVPTEELLAASGVAPTARAEEIDIAGFCALARTYDSLRENAPD